ncbi:SufD family Fe-S cluster assembly protein [Candidatus Dojkabacteria bacterium]|nr:SufD family Fe-S cluster assembly protein [Candidatus Dojkabacteria bacterium]
MNRIQKVIKSANLGFSDNVFTLENNDCIYAPIQTLENGEITDIKTAIQKHDLKNLLWNLIPIETDKITKTVASDPNTNGYYIKSNKNPNKQKTPEFINLESCLVTTKSNLTQKIHNIIIAEENTRLYVASGCLAENKVKANKHYGITEIYVGKNATVIFTMIHVWNPTSKVFPRTVVKVEEGGRFVSNYIILDPVSQIQADPKVILSGKGASAKLNSVIFCHPNTDIDIGGKIELNAPQTKAEIVSHVVANGGKIINRGTLIGNATDINAHLECKAIVLSDNTNFQTIPILEANKANLNMSHEAAIGRISKEQIAYLQTKGISEEKAQQLIVRGFIDNSLGNLSSELQYKLDSILSTIGENAM